MLKAVLFDFDGTLADSREAFLTAYNKLAQRHGFARLTHPLFEQLRARSMRERCKALNVPFHKIPFLIGEISRYYQASMMEIPLMKGAREMVRDLQAAGYRLAILSSNEEKNIRFFLKVHGLDGFSTIMCSRKLFAKDRLMNNYLKRQKLKPDQVVYIGDEARDVLASQKSGIRVVWAAWGFDGAENVRKAGPDFIAERPSDVLQLISEL
ncbi:HAD-IA family hydrolase [Sporolactobacillus terrae]|uniref:HAD family hydrolase n=1 Tax=Sporolactobacillus terrae TaxID=269673 RepID=A0ABX5Q501_9BACL|nr:HAD-IA family hydrolase [Sporolactobacillus terrae]QAA21718.1 HAD family hydrolase [Sporolactobacillus terrae]QAA24690.1 HAD family hydrolase [Sporolactobacillus terrae]UAK16524.1 HAD-IA family hydrolase [Sporolactobacillus terrae]